MGEMRKTYILEPRYCKGFLKQAIEERLNDFMYDVEIGKHWDIVPYDICIRVGQGLYAAIKAECYNNEAKRFEFGKWVFNDIRVDMRLAPDVMKINCKWEDKKVGPNESYMEQIKNIKMYWAPTEACIKPKKVIWNKPATIVYWADGSKTVVKVRKSDKWDPEKGYAMCVVKKFMGLKTFYEPLEAAKKEGYIL